MILRFALDLGAARRTGLLTADVADRDAVATALHDLAIRLERYGLAQPNVMPIGDDRFEVVIPPEGHPESVKTLVLATGELQFRIEVLPSYVKWVGQNGKPRPRSEVWVGAMGFDATADGFQAFKAQEVERWRRQHDAKEAYVPSDARYRVVPREQTARSAPEDFVVLEEPSDARQRLGGEIMARVQPGPDGDGGRAIHFDVKERYQDAFATWTAANVGLPMAIVFNGEVHSAPVLNSSLKDSVVITLGGEHFAVPQAAPARAEEREKQRRLVALLSSPTLAVPVRFEAERRIPMESK